MQEAGALEDVRVGATCRSRAASALEAGRVLIITFHVPGRGRKLESRAHTEPKLEGDAAAVGRSELVVG